MKRHTLPAGTYFIGDPCYAIADDRWSDFCDAVETNDVTEFDGYKMFASSTAYGDGLYLGSDGADYPVDAGLLGCVPLALIKKGGVNGRKDGRIVEMGNSFQVSVTDSGDFNFGGIIINTSLGEDDE